MSVFVVWVKGMQHPLGRLVDHVVTVPARNRDEGDRFGVVADFLDKVRGFLDDFVEALLRPLKKSKSLIEGK